MKSNIINRQVLNILDFCVDNVLVLIIDDVSARRTLVQLILDLRVGDPLRVNRNIKGPNMYSIILHHPALKLLHPMKNSGVSWVDNGIKVSDAVLEGNLRQVVQHAGTDSIAVILINDECGPLGHLWIVALLNETSHSTNLPLSINNKSSRHRIMIVVIDVGQVSKEFVRNIVDRSVESQKERIAADVMILNRDLELSSIRRKQGSQKQIDFIMLL